jgi:hypothetical protein
MKNHHKAIPSKKKKQQQHNRPNPFLKHKHFVLLAESYSLRRALSGMIGGYDQQKEGIQSVCNTPYHTNT